MRHLGSLVLLGSSLTAIGCMKSDSSSGIDSAADAVDSSESVEAEGNVMMAFTDGADGQSITALDAPTAIANIKANIPLRWTCSSGSATATVSGNDITVVLDDCTGPRGLVHVSGTIDLTVSVDASGVITVVGNSSDLKVNGANLSFMLTATYGVMGTTHTLAVQTQGTGTGPLGNEVDHNGNYTITWDTNSQCGSIDGQWSTEFSNSVATASRSNDVNLMRCAGGCPTGTLEHKFLGGQSLTVTFDGSDVATWSTSGGKSGTVNLSCQ